MKKAAVLPAALLILSTFVSTASAFEYGVPCFEWDCSQGDGNCDFDASCGGGGGVWAYSWWFGDGSSAIWQSNPFTSHYYATGAYADVTIELSYFSKLEESATCEIHYRNVCCVPEDLEAECPESDACNCP